MTEHSQSYPDTPDAFHPDKNLPDCMMPDGGECCAGHAALVEDWHKQRREIERLRGVAQGAQRPLAWRYELAGARFWNNDDTPGEYTNWEWRVSDSEPNAGDAMRNVTPLYAFPSTNHQSLDQLLDGMTDENRHEELPVSPLSSTNETGAA